MYKIQKAELKDYAAIKNLMVQALKEDPTAFSVSAEEYEPNSEYWWMSYVNPFLIGDTQEMLLSYDGENLIGTIGIIYDTKERKKHIGSFVWFYVDKNKRGKGLGKDLITQALESLENNKAISKISLLVVASQKEAIEIYKKLGFEINGTLKNELKINEDFFDVLVMEKLV